MKKQDIIIYAKAGLPVYWKSKAYEVTHTQLHTGEDKFLVCCVLNDHCIGLFDTDGNMTHKEEDFFTDAQGLELGKVEILTTVQDWSFGDYSGTIHTNACGDYSIEWDNPAVPEEYEEIEEMIINANQ